MNFNDNMWDYAQLTSNAKNKGGPENFIDSIENEGVVKGAIITTAIFIIGIKIKNTISKVKKKKKEKELNMDNEDQNNNIDE